MTKAQKAIEKKGYKVTFAMSGRTVFATKGNTTYSGTSITALKNKIGA